MSMKEIQRLGQEIDALSVKERLARAIYAVTDFAAPFEELSEHHRSRLFGYIDAILSELENPSEGMLAALCDRGFGHWSANDCAAWRAMIRHIQEGGR